MASSAVDVVVGASKLPDGVRAGVATGQRVTRLLEYAKTSKFVYPIIRCNDSRTANTALAAAKASSAPVILEITFDGANTFAGSEHIGPVAGAIGFAMHVRLMAGHYGVPVIIQSGSCIASNMYWLDGMLEADQKYYKAYGEPLFSAHTISFEHEPLPSIVATSSEYCQRLKKVMCVLNVELSSAPSNALETRTADSTSQSHEISTDTEEALAAAIAMSLEQSSVDDQELTVASSKSVGASKTIGAEDLFMIHQAIMSSGQPAVGGGEHVDGPLGSNKGPDNGGHFFDGDLPDGRSPCFVIYVPSVTVDSSMCKTAQTVAHVSLSTMSPQPTYFAVGSEKRTDVGLITSAIDSGVVALASSNISDLKSPSTCVGIEESLVSIHGEWLHSLMSTFQDLKCLNRI